MSTGNIYVGIDLHKEFFTFVMISEPGDKMCEGRHSTVEGDIVDFASSLSADHHIVLEPLSNCFWFINVLRPYVGSIHLANPYRVRLIAESRLKNDRLDAITLADLLRVGYLPEVYIPPDETIRWRSIVNHRMRLVRDRTRLKNRILGLTLREGRRITASDPFGKRGLAQLNSLELSAHTRAALDNYLESLHLLTAQIKRSDDEIERIGSSDPIVRLLSTIDGIGYFSALAVRAYAGDMSRFRSAKAFAAYTGLVPGYRQSADKHHNGPITKSGVAILRWVLVQAATHAVRRSGNLKRLYLRLCFRSSVGKARTAVAHALARIIYHVWMEARPYYR